MDLQLAWLVVLCLKVLYLCARKPRLSSLGKAPEGQVGPRSLSPIVVDLLSRSIVDR